MFAKLAAIALLQVFLTSTRADDVWNGFVAKWSGSKDTGFYTLPQTLTDAEEQGWTKITNYTTQYSDDVVAYGLGGDPRLSILFFETSGIATGAMLSIPAVDVEGNQPIDYETMTSYITRELDGTKYFTAAFFYTIDESSGARRLFFEEKSEIIEIPTTGTELVAETDFLEKRCVPGMGMHWNKLNNATDCTTLYPWFFTGQDDNIHGIGFQAWGQPTSASERTWWETITGWINWYVVPGAPTCAAVDLVEYGIIVEHIWLIEDPTAVSCDNVTWPSI